MNFKSQLTFLFLFILIPFLSSQYVFDGSYCPGPGEPGDEYLTAQSTVVNASPSSTCDIGTVWGALSENAAGDFEIFVGLFHGNSGQATFRFYFNTDCNSTTGAQEDFETGSSGPTVNVGGAEFRITITSNGSSTIIEEWDATNSEFTTTTSGVNAAVGNSNGCTGSDGQFKEITIPVDIPFFDICDATTFCGDIELTTVLSNAGGSPNSNFCQSPSIIIAVEVNEPPIADFIAVDICEEENGGLGGAFPTVEIPANGSSDADLVTNGDSLDFVWASSDPGDVFSPATGMNVTSIADITTMFTPSGTGPRTITLTLTDRFDCTSTTDASNVAYEINILPWDDDVCTILPVELSQFSGNFKTNQIVELNWETASEVNASSFILERKISNGNFEEIATIAALGSRNSAASYSIEDYLPEYLKTKSIDLFYRLKEVDMDGSFEYSKTIVLSKKGNESSLNIRTNPIVNKTIQLEYNLEKDMNVSPIFLYDLTGKLQKSIPANEYFNAGQHTIEIDVNDLNGGIYLLHSMVDGIPISKRIVILE